MRGDFDDDELPDDADWIDDWTDCDRCDGEGVILICIDDMCRGAGECFHGDGYAPSSIGVPFTAIPRAKYGTKTFWGGIDDETLMIPAYSNQSGQRSKLSEFCSGYWKRDVMTRWAAEQPTWKDIGVDNWVGISYEEKGRRGVPRRKWFRAVYPLLDLRPTTVSGCLAAVAANGWPPPPRSRCRHCPNQSDGEWAELTPEEWAAACDLEDKIRVIDKHAFFHKTLIPLRDVTLQPTDDNGGLFGGCTAGTCY